MLSVAAVALPLAPAAPVFAAPTAPGSLTSRWSTDLADRGQRVVVRGRLRGADVRRVVLQSRQAGRWVVRARTRTRAGRYRLPVPTSSYGTFTYRLVAPVTPRQRRAGLRRTVGVPADLTVARPAPGTARESAAPAAVGDPADYSFIHSAPARWDPCSTITYRVNTSQAPASALPDTFGAVARIERATGLDLEYVGPTDLVPQDSRAADYPPDTQIVVAWADPTGSAMITRPGVAGVGGPMGWGGTVDEDGADVVTWRRGTVVLNSALNDTLRAGFGTGTTLGKLLMHEIGHVVGLGHAEGEDQVMFPTLKHEHPTAWGAGDLTGLRLLGVEQGCLYERDGSAPSFRRGPVTAVSEVTADALIRR